MIANVAYKQPCVGMSRTLELGNEKARVIVEMQRRLKELQKEEVVSPSLKELAGKIGVGSVFCYIAGLLPWLHSELDTNLKLWINKRA